MFLRQRGTIFTFQEDQIIKARTDRDRQKNEGTVFRCLFAHLSEAASLSFQGLTALKPRHRPATGGGVSSVVCVCE